jgi:DNA-directed RNA polymerase specialized sigma24 family protein
MRLARQKVKPAARVVTDEEDIAVDAFHSFLRRCRDGSYAQVRDRHDLWRLLVAITIHKANNLSRAQQRERRDVRRVQGERVAEGGDEPFAMDQLISTDPPPELLATLSDSLSRLFSILPDGELRSMVLYKLDGYSNAEIAAKIGRSLPTVERRLRLIRDIWREEFDE